MNWGEVARMQAKLDSQKKEKILEEKKQKQVKFKDELDKMIERKKQLDTTEDK